MNKFEQLITELQIARLSKPTDDALAKYYQLAEQIETQSGSSLWHKIKATLAWDSRDQLVAQGARGVGDNSYRLLYAADQVEVEVMIESQTSHKHIEGDILPLSPSTDGSSAQVPALIMLLPSGSEPMQTESSSSDSLFETESDPHGRFRFENVTSGIYDMQLILLNGSLIEINGIDLM